MIEISFQPGAGGRNETDSDFMTQPRFETGSANYAWLNSVVAVAEGRLTGMGVEHNLFECMH